MEVNVSHVRMGLLKTRLDQVANAQTQHYKLSIMFVLVQLLNINKVQRVQVKYLSQFHCSEIYVIVFVHIMLTLPVLQCIVYHNAIRLFQLTIPITVVLNAFKMHLNAVNTIKVVNV